MLIPYLPFTVQHHVDRLREALRRRGAITTLLFVSGNFRKSLISTTRQPSTNDTGGWMSYKKGMMAEGMTCARSARRNGFIGPSYWKLIVWTCQLSLFACERKTLT